MVTPLQKIDATAVAQFVRLESCERFLWYRLHPEEKDRLLRDKGLTEQPLSILLSTSGAEHEAHVVAQLAGEFELVDLTDISKDEGAAATVAAITGAKRAIALLQPRLEGTLGDLPAGGLADVILVRPSEEGYRITVADAKASRKDRPEHRIQIAFYSLLLRQMLADDDLKIEGIDGVVWHKGAGPLEAEPFDVRAYEEALHLLIDNRGPVARIAGAAIDDVSYQLGYKCDGCAYNALCMREAAEKESLALVPQLSARDRRQLETAGVGDVVSLATLMQLPTNGEHRLTPSADQQPLYDQLIGEWPLATNLERHVQRARAVAHERHPEIATLGFIYRSGFGSMPSRTAHPELIEVFLEGHHDYIQDRLWALSGLVVGPDGETSQEIIEMLDAPPDDEGTAEGDLIIRWVTRALVALRELAKDVEAVKVHMYVYDTYDQKTVLDALRRHLDKLAGIPDFFDLLTETPALTQSMFTFLAREVRERKNLNILCDSMPLVARRLGFDWTREGMNYRALFRTKIFDNARTLEDGATWYESASRFNSQIPLEYAYGAWGCLPAPIEEQEDQPYGRSRQELEGFLRARVHALHYIAESFGRRNDRVAKEAIQVPAAGEAAAAPSLASVLREFILLEHYAKKESLLDHYGKPIDVRAASGRSLYVKALESAARGSVRFRICADELGLDQESLLTQMEPEEGDWFVLSTADTEAPNSIRAGRLAVIRSIDGPEITVDLIAATFDGDFLRYPHQAGMGVEEGSRYMLDPMCDDFVGHRLLDACSNADHNHLLSWIESDPKALAPRGVPEGEQAYLDEFLEMLERSAAVLDPTARQREVITGHAADRILLVQGPPGTGKTHTIAWSILARLYAAARAGQPYRVLVSSTTHTAVEVVLRDLIRKLQLLQSDASLEALAGPLSVVAIYEEAARPGTPMPDGVAPLTSRAEAAAALAEELVVIGALPQGLHRMLKYRSNPINWNAELFDLLVIDEASQVNLPAGVTAGAALKEPGQAIIVGDHRQMPPILTHDWLEERRRHAQEQRVYASTFEFLLGRDFSSVGLDESFRLHEMHAAFLEDHVYAPDGIGFHSRRQDLLPTADGLEGLVAAALDPHYPVVVIEHAEASSMKRNDVEIEILTPILEAATTLLGLDGVSGLGVVVPHRAQRAALKDRFATLAAAGAIDTVERFQGGERDLIVISATASDPEFVLSEASFLLNPNRLNVAFSRPRKKLIVIGSSTVFRLMPPDMETFEDALLWKRMRFEFSADILWEGTVRGTDIRVSGRRV